MGLCLPCHQMITAVIGAAARGAAGTPGAAMHWKGGRYPPPLLLLQRTTGKSRIGELAPMALCDIHIAGCGEHLPA